MSREWTRKLASAYLIAIMLAAPLIFAASVIPSIYVAQAVTPGTEIQVFPNKIVRGQDVLLTVVQTSGAFSPGATLYIKFSNSDNWGTGSGDAWIGLKPGQTTIPEGSIIYIPDDYSDAAVKGSSSLAEGTAYLLVSDSSDGASGVIGAEITVETGRIPFIETVDPGYFIGVSYSTSSLPVLTVNDVGVTEASPGQTLSFRYWIPGDTVTFYWDYYGGQVLATASGGSGLVSIVIPEAPEGFHAIVAVSDAGYGAFTWIYVKPSLSPDKFSIAGEIGETVTLTGKGFPANAKLDTATDVELTVNDGTSSAVIRARILSGGEVDENGNVVFTIELLDNKPPTIKGGIVDVNVTYESGDIDYVVGGTFKLGEAGPAGDGEDSVKSVMAISTPDAYGDEFIIIFGPDNTVIPSGSTIVKRVGWNIKVAVIDFPANSEVEVYIGHALAGTLVTDARGAAVGVVKVPVLPGYDNDATQISYLVTAKAIDPVTGGTLVGTGTGGSYYYLKIDYSVNVWWNPDGYGPNGNYLLTGLHTIHVEMYGLSPYAKVSVEELINSKLFNVASLYRIYQVETIVGSLGPGYFIADAKGTLHVAYVVAYDYLPVSYDTGDEIDVRITVQTSTGSTLISPTPFERYYTIQIGTGQITDVISSPADITPPLETAGPYQVVHPGDYIEIQISGLVPYELYKIQLDGADVQMYDTSNRRISFAVSNSDGEISVRIQLANSPAVVGLHTITAVYFAGPAAGEVAGAFKFIVSSPRADLYGKAKVFVDPTTATPGETINVIGVNFEAGETLQGGFSTIGALATGNANNHGAVVFEIEVPPVPAGLYAAYIQRTVTYETFPTTILVQPELITPSGTQYNASGDTIKIQIIGLSPNRAYIALWSEEPDELGKPITDTGVPGVGTILTWFTDSSGQLTVEFEIPFGVIYEDYYINIAPADQPDAPVTDPIEVIILPGHGFSLDEPPIAIAGETFTVYVDDSVLSGLKFPANITGADTQTKLLFLATQGTILAKLTLPDGTEDLVPAVASVEGDTLALTFKTPNLEDCGVVGVDFIFSLSAPSIVDNSTNPYTINYTVSTKTLTFGGIKIVKGGGILLAAVEGQMATIVDSVNATVSVMLNKLQELEPVITDINGTVVEIQTTLGTVRADVQTLKNLLNDVSATLVETEDNIIAVINTKAGQINASIQALQDLINSGFANIGNIQGLGDMLGDINNKLDQVLGQTATVQSDLADVKNNIVNINNDMKEVKTSLSDVADKVDNVNKNVSGLNTKSIVAIILNIIIILLAAITAYKVFTVAKS